MNSERAAVSEAGTLRKHSTAMLRHHRMNNEQPETRSFNSRHETTGHTIEAFEDPF
jgi:hypothetical protein